VRVAVAGKGGAGKTTISATLTRLAARAGGAVVAVDADANPNLGVALGLAPDVLATSAPLPTDLVSRRFGGPGLIRPAEEVLEQFAVRGPDGLRLVSMGSPTHAGQGCLCSAHATVAALLEDLGGPECTVVVDLEASPEHFSRGTVRHADVVLLVAEPYYRSLETVRRMAELAADLDGPRLAVVANKTRTVDDEQAVWEFCGRHGLPLAATVPWCDAVGAADRARRCALDSPGTEAVAQAVGGLHAALFPASART
jgi:CO dehydrogenase maturation factor